MEITLRAIDLNDTKDVRILSRQLGYEILNADTEKNIKAIIESVNDNAFVALHENKVIGWIGIAYVLSVQSQPCCEIRGLVVDEQYRNKNVGKMLIEQTKQWCKEKNCDRLRVRCNTKRNETHSFYIHLGFTEKKEQKVFEIIV